VKIVCLAGKPRVQCQAAAIGQWLRERNRCERLRLGCNQDWDWCFTRWRIVRAPTSLSELAWEDNRNFTHLANPMDSANQHTYAELIRTHDAAMICKGLGVGCNLHFGTPPPTISQMLRRIRDAVATR